MRPLRKLLDKAEPLFEKGGRLESYQAIYEMLDTLFYSPPDVSRHAPHVRDSIDLKRVMGLVVVGVLPCALFGMWNTGHQANLAIEQLGLAAPSDWRGALIAAIGIGHDPQSVAAATFYGLLYFVPIYAVTLAAGGVWEVLFAGVRNHEVNEGFFVTSILYALTLPATTPLWQVAIGISFGVVMAKEVFGGTGKNFMNPALAGRAFLYFAYPVEMSGESVWTPPIDVITGATSLAIGAESGVTGIMDHGISWT
ncbi:MAG: RnfABCDGE type electron transport complex subunit D, partial [Polyangiales bacterium]